MMVSTPGRKAQRMRKPPLPLKNRWGESGVVFWGSRGIPLWPASRKESDRRYDLSLDRAYAGLAQFSFFCFGMDEMDFGIEFGLFVYALTQILSCIFFKPRLDFSPDVLRKTGHASFV